MKTENSRSRKLIFMVISCAFIACAMLMTFVACDNKEIDDSNDGVKPARTNHLSYELIKNEYAIDEEVTVKLAYGTCMSREMIERNCQLREDTSVEVFAYRNDWNSVSQSWEENPTKTLIMTIEDFFFENYPYPSETVKAKTAEVAIPKTLFVGNKGEIGLVIDAFCGESCYALVYYQIKDGKICLSKEPEKTDVIIVYREDVEK